MTGLTRFRFSRVVTVALTVMTLFSMWTTTALADGKPKIAVLGLEVVDNGGGVDAASTTFAKSLTEALRTRPKASSGPYVLAVSSERDIVDLRAMNGCDNEARDCLSRMGKDVNSEFLAYGKIERVAKGYQVSMTLFNVDTKQVMQRVTDLVVFAEAQGPSLQTWGKNIYGRLVGAVSQGGIIVRATVQKGTVTVNGKPRGSLVGGELKIAGLAEGSYQVVVESDGKAKYSQTATVVSGEDVTITAAMKDKDAPPDLTVKNDKTGDKAGELKSREGLPSKGSSGHKGLWKGVFFGGLAVAAGGGGYWLNYSRKLDKITDANGALSEGSKKCGKVVNPTDDFVNACNYVKYTKYGAGIVGVGGAIAAVSFYFAFIRSDNSSEQVTASKRKLRDRVVVTPVVSTDGAGAVLRFDF
jgi:hypothetical protein